MNVWDDVIPEEELSIMNKAKHGETTGFGTNPGLLIVDVTKDFTDRQFPLNTGELGLSVIGSIKQLLDKARKASIPIYFTVATVPRTEEQFGKRKGIAPSFEGNKIVEELKPLENELIITKPKPSAFFGTPLISWLIQRKVDTLIVTGLVTSGCIRATVVDAYSYNLRVIIPEECVGDRSTISHKVNLFDMQMKYADVMKLDQVLRHLNIYPVNSAYGF